MRPYSAPGPRGRAAARIVAGFAYRPLGGYRDLATYGDAVELPLYPGKRLFVLSRPAHAEHVLAKNQDNYVKAFTYRPLRVILGDGLLTSEGTTWRRHRRLVQPMFSHRHVAGFAPQMAAGARRTLKRWDSLDDDAVIDANAAMSALTLDVVGRALFGSDLTDETARLRKALATAQRGVALGSLLPTLWGPRSTRAVVKATRGFWGILETIDAPVRRVIADRRSSPRSDEPHDLLDLLIATRDDDDSGFSDVEIRDEITTFMLAGHETTAVALGWSLALLSAYPQSRERLEGEVDEVLTDRDADAADLDRLPWTRAVVDEAMRIYPPAWTIERDALADDEVDGVRIPAGSTVAVPPYLVHRHPESWPDPEGFDPRRFLADEERHRYAYIPFGGGRRGCVGAGFARLEAGLLLATLARRYRLDLVGAGLPEPRPEVTLHPGRTLPMRLIRRH